jgi:ABC-2 type transport system permease protein
MTTTSIRSERSTPRSPFVELSISNAKELIRNKKGSISILFMFGFLFILIALLDAAMPGLGILRTNLPTIATIGFMAITFLGTAVPIVSLRERGTLRLLGTTPLKKGVFIAAQTPVRLVAGLVVAVIVVGAALALGALDPSGLLRLVVTFAVGLAMFFALAYLLASRSRNTELVNNVAVMLPIVAMFASGDVFPREIIPEPVAIVLEGLPTTWFVRAAAADLSGTAPAIPVPVLWLMMAAVAAVAAFLAARFFVWDDRDR